MHILIVHPMGLEIVYQYSLATLGGDPDIGTATVRVNPHVGYAQSGPIVYLYVRRSSLRRTDAGVRAAGLAVGIDRDL
jgi:hypothetical protein